ncbi:hypothetical protein OAQ27_00835 [Aquiluna sp.]|nr:hypothetical protein [Aquiluna sp.]
MLKKDTRKGVSLGSIFALVASLLFVGGVSAPASAADGENSVVMDPAKGTSYTMLITEDFQVVTRLGANVNGSLVTTLKWLVEKPVGVGLSSSNKVGTAEIAAATWTDDYNEIEGTATSSVIAADGATTTSGNIASQHVLKLQVVSFSANAQQPTSLSTAVTVHVTPWLDLDGDGTLDTSEPQGDRQAISFVPWSGLGATVDIAAVSAGDTRLTGSSVIPSTVNKEQLNSNFVIEVIGKDYADQITKFGSYAGGDSKSSAISGTVLSQKATNFVSVSSVTTVPMNPTSYSARLYYGTIGEGTQVAVKNIESTTNTVGTLSISPVTGTNITSDWKVRPNQTYTVKVHASTGSPAVSVSGAVLNVALSGASLTLGVKEISVNGAASTTSYPTALSVTTGTDGYASFTLKTFGFANEDEITVTVTKGATNTSGTLTTFDPVYTVTEGSAYYAVAPGASVAMSYAITDQWGVASARTDQRLKVERAATTGFNYSETISYVAVSAGAATFNYSGQPATATGSTDVTVTLQRMNSNNGTYATDSGSSAITTDIVVTTTANSFGSGLATSFSASVSYFPSTVSWTTVQGTVTVTGSAVVVSAPAGLIFRASAALPTTTSGGITVAAGSGGAYSFEVAGRLVGSHTMTLTNGTATTTSLFVVDAVSDDNGYAMSFDISSVTPGKTAIVTGTLVDENGNPVDTTNEDGDATIAISYTGNAGIPVGTLPTETNADGEFKLSLLTSAADEGTLTVTAVYLKDGASTAAAEKISKVHTITIGGSSAAADDTKVNAGSFKGYVAVYAKGYEGQRLSAKIGNDWVVVESLASNFERVVDFTGAGYTIAVRIYIDRVLVDTITVTTK